MGTDKRTLITLNTIFWNPFWYINSYTTFFISCTTTRKCSILNTIKGAYRKTISLLSTHRTKDGSNKFRFFKFLFFCFLYCFPRLWYIHLNCCFKTSVNSSIIHINDFLTFFTICLYYSFL